ncbi:MAG TPA: DUF6285 domain-containing protein [Solimonas sp.]
MALIPQLEGKQRFELRVALNAFDIIERETVSAGAAAESERMRLVQLLDRDGTLVELRRELCLRLRDGRQRHDAPELLSALRAGVLARLAFDNPGFKPFYRDGDPA